MIRRRTLVAASAALAAIGAIALRGPGRRTPEGYHEVEDETDMAAALRRVVGDELSATRAAADWIEAVMAPEGGVRGLVNLDAVLLSFLQSTTAAAAWEDGHDPIFLGLHTPSSPCVNGLSDAAAPFPA